MYGVWEENDMQAFEDYRIAIRWAAEHINAQTTADQVDPEKLAWAFRALFFLKATDAIPPLDEQLRQIYGKLLRRGPLEE
jgi:hypothetical protein